MVLRLPGNELVAHRFYGCLAVRSSSPAGKLGQGRSLIDRNS